MTESHAMKLTPKFSLATLLVIVALSAFTFFGIAYFSPSSRYQRQHDVENLRHLLSTRIEAGDTQGHVMALLGPGEPDDGNSYLDGMLRWQSGETFKPAWFPDGIHEGDVFIHYEAKPTLSYTIQLRDGKLVNHDRDSYVGPDDPVTSLSN